LSGRGLCDELIARPEESYRLCCVVVCDLETSRICTPYVYDISTLRVNASVPGGNEKRHTNSVSIFNVPVDTQTGYFPNASQKFYLFSPLALSP
jgi:hypothetical protein